MEFQNIAQFFYYQAAQKSGKRFLSFEGTFYTYGETAKIVSKISKVLSEDGVKKGTKVLIMLNNSPEFIFSALAVFACGAIAIPINVFFKHSEVAYIAKDSECKFIISSYQFKHALEGINEKCPDLKKIFAYDDVLDNSTNLYSAIQGVTAEEPIIPVERKDLALFIYTSGTTGHPKGAMLSHNNLLKSLESFQPVLKANHKDKFLVMLPMFHTYTFTTCILFPISLGASIIILSSVTDMKKESFKKLLIFQRPTFVLGVPQIYAALVKSPMPKWFIKFLYPIKMHISGGAALPMEIFEEFREKFGNPVIEGYGLSEASPVVSFNPPEKPKHGTVGLPLPGVKVKVVDKDEVEITDGTVGELIVKGPNIMQGYWKMPKATDDALKNGWLFTGDMATIDKDGYITIVDRKKDLILVRGMNVYPREIEEVIYTFKGVEAAAVIGLPSDEYGEIIAAYIKPNEGVNINEHDLRVYLKKELANFKQPKIIKITNDIPLTATGKVMKRQLKEMVKNGQI